ncbi:MAG: hypothetical protein JSR45_02490 [Proteobacteria bacterium]|nr:hypothetical protein [Pseudomonadota bacterium]
MLTRRAAITAAVSVASPVAAATAVDVRAFGARGDGVADDTEALRKAHAQDRPVFYPKTGAFYRVSAEIPVSADVSSNGATIRCAQDGTEGRSIFRIRRNRRPITITGLILDGLYRGQMTGGQWSMCVYLEGASDVTITRNVLRSPYGDCVYIGSPGKGEGCSRIRVVSNQLLNPRRCCVAVVCGKDVEIRDNTMLKTARFVSTIAMEPNPNGFDYVTQVRILNNRVDTPTPFITASKFNGVETEGLIIRGNRGKAERLLYATTAHIRAPVIDHNAIEARH